MSIMKKPITIVMTVIFLLVTAPIAAAATSQYFFGALSMDQVAQSGTYTSYGGKTDLGTRQYWARNQSTEYGYVYLSTTGWKFTENHHSPKSNLRNQASWTSGTSHVSGTVDVRAFSLDPPMSSRTSA